MKRARFPLALALVLVLAGCGSSVGSVTGPPRPDSKPIARGAAVLTCDTYPFIGSGPADWRRDSAHAGPLGLGGSGRDFTSGQLGPRAEDGLYHVKIPVLLEGHRPAVLSVPLASRSRVGIETVSSDRPLASVTLRPCPDKPRTIWAAGLALRGRSPVTLEVRVGARLLTLEVGRID